MTSAEREGGEWHQPNSDQRIEGCMNLELTRGRGKKPESSSDVIYRWLLKPKTSKTLFNIHLIRNVENGFVTKKEII